jgi:outer membrane protein assembly factor BamD
MSGRILLPLVIGEILLILGGCTSIEKRPSAKEYYSQADEAYSKEDFLSAVDTYRDLLDQYPLNPYAEEAQLKIAYSYYIEKKYAESIAAFNDFERAYPTSMHLPFVEYYRGMCYLEQMRSLDRDQSVTEKAHDHFRAVTDRFPDSPFTPLSEKKIRVCRDAMAAHELMVARFYDRYDNTLAAKARLRAIIENYPETDATIGALEQLENLLIEEDKKDLADIASQALAVRKTGLIAQEQSSQSSKEGEEINALPAPGVDPLLTLVAELKKQEEEVRQHTQETISAQIKEMTERTNQIKENSEDEE